MDNHKKSVVIVDDNPINLNVGRNALSGRYNVLTVTSGKKLLQILEKMIPDIILLDIEMPEMDGYEVIKVLKDSVGTAQIPVIFLTAVIDPESELKGLSLGAIDYITKPFSPELLQKRIEVHLFVESQKKKLQIYSTNLEEMVDEKRRTVFELQNAILKTVAELVESRDSVTGGHIERTQTYLKLLVDALLHHDVYSDELSSWDIGLFIMSSQLHDVGKISIKDNILMKPSKLTEEEFERMKEHTAYGMNIIMKIEENTKENAFLKHARIMAGSHHEKWDGSGYPLGLKGEAIPLQGRLMAIVDVYDALTNDRPYKAAFPHGIAVNVIKDGIGRHFDPLIGDIFLVHEKEFERASKLSTHDIYFENSEASGALNSSVLNTVANIVDARNEEGNTHSKNVQLYLKIFIEALLTNERYMETVSAWDSSMFLLCAQLHDVGKIAINDNLLNKTTKLTNEEFVTIKSHADIGVKVVKQIKVDIEDKGDMIRHAEAMVGSHHEKWDGSGYPLGLKGEAIPLQGRVMAIVDVYDALTSDRPQRKKMPHPEAIMIIKSYSGTQFDPGLVDVFMEHEKSFLMAGNVE